MRDVRPEARILKQMKADETDAAFAAQDDLANVSRAPLALGVGLRIELLEQPLNAVDHRGDFDSVGGPLHAELNAPRGAAELHAHRGVGCDDERVPTREGRGLEREAGRARQSDDARVVPARRARHRRRVDVVERNRWNIGNRRAMHVEAERGEVEVGKKPAQHDAARRATAVELID